MQICLVKMETKHKPISKKRGEIMKCKKSRKNTLAPLLCRDPTRYEWGFLGPKIKVPDNNHLNQTPRFIYDGGWKNTQKNNDFYDILTLIL